MAQTALELKVTVTDELTLTPFAGATLAIEILKGVLHQKCQIPYPYNRLKSVVEKRRKRLNSEENVPKLTNFSYENHYRIVSTTYDYMESLGEGIKRAFCEDCGVVKEMVIMMGTSPYCPKEVFILEMPFIANGHIEQNHIGELNKHMQKVLRKIFLSQSWIDSIEGSVSCTNIYVYLKKEIKENQFKSETFEQCPPLHISNKVKHTRLCIIYNNSSEASNCCPRVDIFEDNTSGQKSEACKATSPDLEVKSDIIWCRSKGALKGFKDFFVNKVSVCELW